MLNDIFLLCLLSAVGTWLLFKEAEKNIEKITLKVWLVFIGIFVVIFSGFGLLGLLSQPSELTKADYPLLEAYPVSIKGDRLIMKVPQKDITEILEEKEWKIPPGFEYPVVAEHNMSLWQILNFHTFGTMFIVVFGGVMLLALSIILFNGVTDHGMARGLVTICMGMLCISAAGLIIVLD